MSVSALFKFVAGTMLCVLELKKEKRGICQDEKCHKCFGKGLSRAGSTRPNFEVQ